MISGNFYEQNPIMWLNYNDLTSRREWNDGDWIGVTIPKSAYSQVGESLWLARLIDAPGFLEVASWLA